LVKLTAQVPVPQNDWNADRAGLCARIANSPAVLKILLKTKNDPILLERWIEHHCRIVGARNILIFDNMSDDPGVLSIYDRHPDVLVVRFTGFHNNVHRVEMFSDLYAALRDSAQFFVFLDTDEFLTLIEGERCHPNAAILEFLQSDPLAQVFPGTWLYNTNWTANQFISGTTPGDLSGGLAWGKPVLRSNAPLGGYLNHNIQLARTLFPARIRANLFVLHLANLSPQQRIASNINKLIARGFAQPADTAEVITQYALDGVSDSNIVQYVSEIRRLLPLRAQLEAQQGTLRPGCIELSADGTISYYSELEHASLLAFIADPMPVYAAALRDFSAKA
jgi:hypothetical protein